MKILVIWKALVADAYHKRFEALASFKNVELTIIAPTSWNKIGLKKKFCREYRIIPARVMLNGYNHFHWYPELSKIVRQAQPDIFHIEEEHYSHVTFQAISLARKNNIRCLFVSLQNIYKKYPFPFSWIERYNLENADYAIAGNNEAKDILARKGFANDRISILPQGVDAERFCKMESTKLKSKLRLDAFTIGYLGRFVIEKGIMDLLQAVSRINSNVNLLIVGSGKIEYKIRRKIEEEGRRLGILEQIRIIDTISSPQVPDYLNCMDCLVLPSHTTKKWKEQFGRVLTEAMSCEVPVIGSDSGEIPNVIGDCGLVFKEGDVGDLYTMLDVLINNKNVRVEFAEKGRQRVLNHFTQEKVAEETYKIYQKILC
jgi:glycosyltransferase involved in cell wall biosynthesis